MLTDLPGVRFPLIQAPMAGVQGVELALAVSGAGALGSLPCAMLGLEALPREHFLFLWAGIFVIAAIFLLGMIRFKGESGEIGPGRLLGGLIVALLAMYFATGAFGNRLDWVMESIAPPYSKRMAWAGSDQEGGSGESKLAWTIVKDDFDGAKALAVEDDKLVFLNITGVT